MDSKGKIHGFKVADVPNKKPTPSNSAGDPFFHGNDLVRHPTDSQPFEFVDVSGTRSLLHFDDSKSLHTRQFCC